MEGDNDLRAWEKAVTRHYLDWKNTQVISKGPKAEHTSSWLYALPELHERRAPGATCMNALAALESGQKVNNNSKGCGGVMRVAPVALCRDLMDMPMSFVTTLGGTVAEVTHQHPLGFMPAALMTDLLRRVMDSECENNKENLKACVAAADYMREDGTVIPNSELTRPSDFRPRSYAYCSDTAYCRAIVPQIAGADLLYHEATFCDADEQSAAATRHSTASQAAAIAQEAGVGKLAIGHYSIRYREENQLLQEAREVFPETVLSDEMMQLSL